MQFNNFLYLLVVFLRFISYIIYYTILYIFPFINEKISLNNIIRWSKFTSIKIKNFIKAVL